MPEQVFIFKAVATKQGLNGYSPEMHLICRSCEKELDGDWRYNFTGEFNPHAQCVIDGLLRVEVQITGLHVWNFGIAVKE